MINIILFIILFYLVLNNCKSNYTNFVQYNKPFERPLITCPENYGKNFKRLQQQNQEIQPFGYTSNEYLDKTRFIEVDQPLPTNPDFFM